MIKRHFKVSSSSLTTDTTKLISTSQKILLVVILGGLLCLGIQECWYGYDTEKCKYQLQNVSQKCFAHPLSM